MIKAGIRTVAWLLMISCGAVSASEVIEETATRVVVREHPRTGRPYVSIVSSEVPDSQGLFPEDMGAMRRPDYRMLDPNIKEGAVPYEGPWSDRKKVYVFAASLAALGTAGGALGMAAASSTAASASGAGVYVGAGTAVGVGTTGAAWVVSKEKPDDEEFTRSSESRLLEAEKSE